MIELPAYLKQLLSADDDSPKFKRAAQEVERQPHQQRMLEQHALEQSSVLGEALQALRDSGLPPEAGTETSSVLIEVDATLDLEVDPQASVDFEQVALGFLDAPSHPELLGRFGRYEIERVLGSGGMGVVLKGYDTDLHRVVAIKVLAPHLAHHGTARRRFAREAQAAAAVVHPNIIQIHNVDSESEVPYLVMQYVPGESLQRRVDYAGPLSVVDCLRISMQIAAGLNAAHEQGLVHRDVKPANILLEEKVDRVLLSDFGLARAVDDASLTKTGIVAGTPFYMSPEQAFGNSVDRRSDLFSLGSVMYFMLSGRPPFRASGAMAVLHRICQTEHRPLRELNPEVPRELAELIDRCLEKNPEERVESASELQMELLGLLSALQAGQLALPLRASHAATEDRIASLARPMLFAILFLGVCICFLAGGYWRQSGHGLSHQGLLSPLPEYQDYLREAAPERRQDAGRPDKFKGPQYRTTPPWEDPMWEQAPHVGLRNGNPYSTQSNTPFGNPGFGNVPNSSLAPQVSSAPQASYGKQSNGLPRASTQASGPQVQLSGQAAQTLRELEGVWPGAFRSVDLATGLPLGVEASLIDIELSQLESSQSSVPITLDNVRRFEMEVGEIEAELSELETKQ